MRLPLILFVPLVLAAASCIGEAHASPGSVALELAQSAPAVGPGHVDSWAKTCTTTATTIVPSGFNVLAFECSAPESTETDATQFVAIGDSGIGDPAFATRTSPVMCGSGCAASSKSVNAKQAYCRSDTDDVVIYCWAVVGGLSSAP